MDTISSAKFRTSYAKLSEVTEVTVNGHRIGIWTPSATAPRVERTYVVPPELIQPPERSRQAQRDAILRRINAKS